MASKRRSGLRLVCDGEARTTITGGESQPKLLAEKQRSIDFGNPFVMAMLVATTSIQSFYMISCN